MPTTRILYIELKSGYQHNGPAWIARVELSKSRRTVYFNGLALHRLGGQGTLGNHHDPETGDEYWISGVKKDQTDRHSSGSGKTLVEDSTVADYLEIVGKTALDPSRYLVTKAIKKTDRRAAHEAENQRR